MLQFLPALLSGGMKALLPTLGNILMSTAMSSVGTKLFGRDVGGLFGMMMGKDFFDVTGGAKTLPKNLTEGVAKAATGGLGETPVAQNFLNPTTDTFSKGLSEQLMSQSSRGAFSLPEIAKNASSVAAQAPLKTLQIANVAGPKAGFGGLGDKWKNFAGPKGGKLAMAMMEQDQTFRDEKEKFAKNNRPIMWIPRLNSFA